MTDWTPETPDRPSGWPLVPEPVNAAVSIGAAIGFIALADASSDTERAIYGQWLTEREKELNILYPNQPEIVAEVLAMTIRARVLDLCPLDRSVK